MKRLGKFIKRALIAALSLLGALFLLLFLLLQWPGAFFNARTLELARSLAAKAGWEVRWESVEASAGSVSLLRKRFRVEFKKFCAENSGEGIRFCFPDLLAEAQVGFSGLLPRIAELGPIEARGGDLEIALRQGTGPQPAPPAKKTGKKTRFSFPRWMRKARVLPVYVSFSSVDVVWIGRTGRGGETRVRGAFDLFAETEKARAAMARVSLGASELGRGGLSGGAAIEFRNSQGFWNTAGWEASSAVAGRIAGASARIESSFTPRATAGERKGDVFDYDFSVRGRYADGSGIPKEHRPAALVAIVGRVSRTIFSARLDGWASNLVPGIARVRVFDCGVRADASTLGVDCPAKLSVPVPPRKLSVLRVPSEAGVRALVDLKTGSYPPPLGRPVEGSVRVVLEPVLTPLLNGAGEIRSSFSGIPARFPEGWRFESELGVRVAITDFGAFAESLRDTTWSPPAPFQVLKGSVAFEARGRFDQDAGVVPFRFATQLSSPHQIFDVMARGGFEIPGWKPGSPGAVSVDVELNAVELALPKLDLAVPPALVPDTRIHAPRRKRSAPSTARPFGYFIRFHTPAGQTIRVLSNLAQAPVPIALDVSLRNDRPLSGYVRVHAFPVELFHRKARIDHFDVELAAPASESRINGAAVVSYADYTVTTQLLDTIEKPRVILTSDPPLPESQLIAALLFGRPLEELDPDQAASVGSAGAAFADGALGLASLYLLASTPVQSVGYDPATGTVTATVRLTAGTSLNVGATPSEFRTVSLRKRLGPHWTITTDLEHPSDPTARTVSAFLEWSRRY